MSDMQITVWLRRKTCNDLVTSSFLYIFINNLFNKILGNCTAFHKLNPPEISSQSLLLYDFKRILSM